MVKPLIKYVGSKSRSASRICSIFPSKYNTYYEPFFGSGAVLGALRPEKAVVCDICKPLIEMWNLVKNDPASLSNSYKRNWQLYAKDRRQAYEASKERFNTKRNPHDFLFISRSCYGGIIRFRKDGYLSTPLGAHTIIGPVEFEKRLAYWHQATQATKFICADFSEILADTKEDDLVYCDPPYGDSQRILYGAQAFNVNRLYEVLAELKSRGSFLALSIDGVKKSGRTTIDICPPEDLFESELFLSLGGSMLKRFWRGGEDMLDEHVRERLLTSYDIASLDKFFEIAQGFWHKQKK